MSRGRPLFSWNPKGTCIVGSWNNPESKCVFDFWSAYHFYFSGLIFIGGLIIFDYFQIKIMSPSNWKSVLNWFILINILHIVEEYLGNTGRFSLEGVVIDSLGPLFVPGFHPEYRQPDNDYLQNSIGDVFSGILGALIPLLMFWGFGLGKITTMYIWLMGFPPLFAMLIARAPKLMGFVKQK